MTKLFCEPCACELKKIPTEQAKTLGDKNAMDCSCCGKVFTSEEIFDMDGISEK